MSGNRVKPLSFLLSHLLLRQLPVLIRSDQFNHALRQWEKMQLSCLQKLDHILVISDLNIGDAINTQICVEVLKQYFPETEVDYVCSTRAYPLIENNPHLSRIFAVPSNDTLPADQTRKEFKASIQHQHYDLVLDLCPFLHKHDFKPIHGPVLFPLRLVSDIMKNCQERGRPHYLFRMSEYIQDIIAEFPTRLRPQINAYPFAGNKLYLTHEAITKRNEIMAALKISPEHKHIFFNPDASNTYTWIDPEKQLGILIQLLQYPHFDKLFIGAGFHFQEIEWHLFSNLPLSLRKRVVLLSKKLPINVCAALVDACEVFITGDTGPMHVAAARKIARGAGYSFRNQVALVTLYGASDARIYGYDSFKPGYEPANQAAPAKAFEAAGECKDITCTIQRVVKTCQKHRCFERLNPRSVADYVANYLASRERSEKIF